MSNFKNPVYSLLTTGAAIFIGVQALPAQAAEPADPPAISCSADAACSTAPVVAMAPVPAPAPELTAAAPAESVEYDGRNPSGRAVTAAVADAISTHLAIAGGAVEANPLVSPTPLGLLALTGGKILLVRYANSLPVEEKRMVLKTASSAWGGAAVNNLLVLVGAPVAVPIIAGIVFAVFTWNNMQKDFDKHDRMAAARQKPVVNPVEQEKPLVAQAGETWAH